jgi:hypothetical protein
MLRRVALVRTDVLEELSASFIRVTRIGELGTTLGATSNQRTLQEPHGVTSPKTPLFAVRTVRNIQIHCGQSVPQRRHIMSPLQSPTG